ncbi:hypothetical protein Aazo_1675 ['Nostoc azollae' 0708]|jgi:hypothetical protein|uniref:Uncharacterized protein n=1 Tax=Nostoc azollae (strain 0708) TaxID=551115 RepID=D7E540_NOSA0|nr:hypothetical protein Aazo_1675 ['Nostoc azollae' 0708]
MLRQLQFAENQKAKWDRLIDQRDEAIAQLDT